MARIARIIAPNYPHHITQRGNRRQTTFFCEEDYLVYIDLIAQWCRHYRVDIWSWCLMPNHVHLIAVPQTTEGLARAIGETHRRYTRHINFRENWRGHLWQGRFASLPMDEQYLLATSRYIEMNPVAANLVEHPEDYRWSSTRAHLEGKDDDLVKVAPLHDLVSNWSNFLSLSSENELDLLYRHERTGRPLGTHDFVEMLEQNLKRILQPQKPGPKRKSGAS